MAEVEIGIGKSGRRAYGFDDIAIVPSRRTRDPEDVDISWEIDAFRFELPLMGAAMDGVISPATAIEIGRLGGVGVLNLEGLWCRYEDPEPLLEEIADLSADKATLRMQEIYQEPLKPELIAPRIREIKAAGVVSCASVTPQRTAAWATEILAAELDLLVIQGTVVSAEHVSKTVEPLNLKRFVRELDIPVIVGRLRQLPGRPPPHAHGRRRRAGRRRSRPRLHHPRRCSASACPQATAIADAKAARMRHLDETGVYCQVIADGGMGTGRRHRQGHRVRRRRRHDRLAHSPPPPRHPGGATTGAWPPSTPRCHAAPG